MAARGRQADDARARLARPPGVRVGARRAEYRVITHDVYRVVTRYCMYASVCVVETYVLWVPSGVSAGPSIVTRYRVLVTCSLAS